MQHLMRLNVCVCVILCIIYVYHVYVCMRAAGGADAALDAPQRVCLCDFVYYICVSCICMYEGSWRRGCST
jgi:hypothetical protein